MPWIDASGYPELFAGENTSAESHAHGRASSGPYTGYAAVRGHLRCRAALLLVVALTIPAAALDHGANFSRGGQNHSWAVLLPNHRPQRWNLFAHIHLAQDSPVITHAHPQQATDAGVGRGEQM